MATSVAVARRYAEAFFALAQERGGVDRWREQLADAVDTLRVREVAEAMHNPRVSVADRVRLVTSVLPQLDPQTRNLLRLLVERGRVGTLPDVLAHYNRLADQASGVVRAEVVSAVPVDSQLEATLARRLSEKLGGEVQTTVRQDPSIIGGLVIRVGDRVIDGSVRTRLQQLQAALA